MCFLEFHAKTSRKGAKISRKGAKIFTQRCKDFTQRREVNILCVLCDVLCVFACNFSFYEFIIFIKKKGRCYPPLAGLHYPMSGMDYPDWVLWH